MGGGERGREGRQGELNGVPARLEGAWPEGVQLFVSDTGP
jgi:hypothetical protein